VYLCAYCYSVTFNFHTGCVSPNCDHDCARARPQTPPHTRTHARTRTHAHARTRTRARATHTHTHTCSSPSRAATSIRAASCDRNSIWCCCSRVFPSQNKISASNCNRRKRVWSLQFSQRCAEDSGLLGYDSVIGWVLLNVSQDHSASTVSVSLRLVRPLDPEN
jgi:hypothetical protein